MIVSEIYDAWQGEGPSTGRRCTLVRLHGCNLRCSWCDTPWTWDPERPDPKRPGVEMSIAEIVARCPQQLVIITGGEPLMQDLEPLVDLLEREIEVETNGTRPAPSWADQASFNVSPKLANSGHTSRLHPSWRSCQSARFKFVCRTPADVRAIDLYDLMAESVWVMPEGTDWVKLLDHADQIAPAAAAAGYNFTLRQHVLLYGDERGR